MIQAFVPKKITLRKLKLQSNLIILDSPVFPEKLVRELVLKAAEAWTPSFAK
jgi:hypothetical protein